MTDSMKFTLSMFGQVGAKALTSGYPSARVGGSRIPARPISIAGGFTLDEDDHDELDAAAVVVALACEAACQEYPA